MSFSLSRFERRPRIYSLSGINPNGSTATLSITTAQIALVPANRKVTAETDWTSVTVEGGDEFEVLWTGADAPLHDDSVVVPIGEWDLKVNVVEDPEIDIIDGERITCS